jgi:hypothetical protein
MKVIISSALLLGCGIVAAPATAQRVPYGVTPESDATLALVAGKLAKPLAERVRVMSGGDGQAYFQQIAQTGRLIFDSWWVDTGQPLTVANMAAARAGF